MCTYKYAPTVSELIDHIVTSHHRFLHAELPQLQALVTLVADMYGEEHPQIERVRELFVELVHEMRAHMEKEEGVLFPMMRHMAEGNLAAQVHCGGVQNPIRAMEMEHAECETALAMIRTLTKGFAAPAGVCSEYRELMARLAKLDADLREHLTEETEILFPRMIGIGDGRLVEDWHH